MNAAATQTPRTTTRARGIDALSSTMLDSIVGAHAGLTKVVERARLLAKVDAAVLLQGETGVGKEVFARAIHDGGERQQGPFIALNCGGLPRELLASELFGYVDGAFTGARHGGRIGKIEAADGGTLFLDEIAEMPVDLQPYLLRVLEGGEVYPVGSTKARTVRFRLVAACNRDLRSEVAGARFRTDLFYRVSVTSLVIPPLREHKEDLPALVEHFARTVAEHRCMSLKRFAPEVLEAFEQHFWPGNVRELRNVVEMMVLLADRDVIGLDALPAELSCSKANESHRPRALDTGLGMAERDAITAAIRTHRGNLTQAARKLGISRSTLYLKLKKHALDSLLVRARAECTGDESMVSSFH